jgi:large subunit ribosomal protein L25
MANVKTLKAHTRKRSGSAALNALRREGLIPAVVYGNKQESINIRMDRKAVTDLLVHSVSENILVTLEIEDRKENKLALVKDVQHDPLSGKILHMDFQSVEENETIRARIPLELSGECAGAKAGGMLEFLTHSLDITCVPKNLPEKVSVDVSNLNIGETVRIKDLKLPTGVNAKADSEVIIAIVAEPKVVETPAAAAADAPAKGKAAPAAKAKK